MASVYKISIQKAICQLRHNTRQLPEKRPSFDSRLSGKNEILYYNGQGVCPISQEAVEDTYKKRVQGAELSRRKDLNTLCEWVVTLPQNVPPSKENAFFFAAQQFIADRYGADNFVAAFVHRDEPTARPHIHIDFVPCVVKLAVDEEKKKTLRLARDKEIVELKSTAADTMTVSELRDKINAIKERCKRNVAALPKMAVGYKISAKEVLTIRDLKTFHPDFQKFCTKELGFTPHILTGITKAQGGNKTRGAYRLEQAEAQLREKTAALEEARAKNAELTKCYNTLRIASAQLVAERLGAREYPTKEALCDAVYNEINSAVDRARRGFPLKVKKAEKTIKIEKDRKEFISMVKDLYKAEGINIQREGRGR